MAYVITFLGWQLFLSIKAEVKAIHPAAPHLQIKDILNIKQTKSFWDEIKAAYVSLGRDISLQPLNVSMIFFFFFSRQ